MISKIKRVLEYSRVFSLPMTIFSWLVIFTYSLINSGNIKYGLIALLGICFVHLGTNLIDDFFDYKSLIKRLDFNKEEYLKQSQKTKCRYIINGAFSENQLLLTAGVYFSIALCIGYFLFLKCGFGVFYFGLIGAILALLYPFLSKIRLSEFAVAIAYGPALFGGVYYVMTGTYSNDVYILSIPTTLMTVVLLYVHTVMDYNFDKNEGKKTVANSFKNPKESLIILKYLLTLSYASILLLCIYDIVDWYIFSVFITIPIAFDLFKSLQNFTSNTNPSYEKKWFHFPMKNIDKIMDKAEANFVFRLLQSRNLMIYFTILIIIALIIDLGI